MPIGFRCTGCRSRLHVPKRWAGNTLPCPNCGTRVVVPAVAQESTRASGVSAFEDAAVERSLQSLQSSAAKERGGIFADDSFNLPPPDDADTGRSIRGGRRDGITLSHSTIYAYSIMVPVIAVTAFLLGCWWAATGGR
jgi:hypothetical protein